MNEIADVIDSGKATEALLKETYVKLQDAVHKEFCDESWKEPILNQVGAILVKGSPNFVQALSLLDSAGKPQETCNLIIRLAANQGAENDKLLRIILRCFVYLICIEGAYDQVLRFLYSVYKKRRPYSKAKIQSIVENFANAKIAGALTDGYNSTVRNAIAHATFSLNASTETAVFTDLTNQTTLSFQDFILLVDKILHVNIAVSTLLISQIMVGVGFREAIEVTMKQS